MCARTSKYGGQDEPVVPQTALWTFVLGLTVTAAVADPPSLADPNAMDIYLDRGSSGLSRCLAAIRTRASILMVTAHPDDEDGGMLALQTRGLGARGMLLTLTRGEGGQNAITSDMYDAMGLIRTQELLAGQPLLRCRSILGPRN